VELAYEYTPAKLSNRTLYYIQPVNKIAVKQRGIVKFVKVNVR
jgi:hypothetical protein